MALNFTHSLVLNCVSRAKVAEGSYKYVKCLYLIWIQFFEKKWVYFLTETFNEWPKTYLFLWGVTYFFSIKIRYKYREFPGPNPLSGYRLWYNITQTYFYGQRRNANVWLKYLLRLKLIVFTLCMFYLVKCCLYI